MPLGSMAHTRRSTTDGSDGAKGGLPPHNGRTGGRERHAEDDHDRRDLSEGAPHGVQPAGKKGGLGRLIGHTKGGMNTKLHAVTEPLASPSTSLNPRRGAYGPWVVIIADDGRRLGMRLPPIAAGLRRL